MSVSYFVRYRGPSEDAEFLADHYRRRHVPILAEWPRLRGLSVYFPATEWHDPFPIKRGETRLLTEMTFESIEDLNHALASEERARARADFTNLQRLANDITHQAMIRETIL